VDEETGLTGAFGLKPGFLKGTILLNLDSEDDGQLFIGCAGGKDTVAHLPYRKESLAGSWTAYKVSVSGLLGGHSGDDISKGRGNAVKLMNRLLWEATNRFQIRINTFDGGNLRNAIAREAFAVVVVPETHHQAFEAYAAQFRKDVKAEYRITEPDLEVAFEPASQPGDVLTIEDQNTLLNVLYACPHGVIAWSADIPDFVETSTNLASVKIQEDSIKITTSQRSSVESAKEDICNMVASTFHLAEADVKHTDGYPGWTPNPESEIVDITRKAYEELFNEEPEVLAVHAGLECGLIGAVYPEMDMISYGPTIKGAHSPDERLHIHTVDKFWDLTLRVLERIPEDNS
jgi:dipeptidase D